MHSDITHATRLEEDDVIEFCLHSLQRYCRFMHHCRKSDTAFLLMEIPPLPGYARHVNRDLLASDTFEFVVGEKTMECCCMDAEMISPMVGEIRRSDPTSRKYLITSNVDIEYLERICSHVVRDSPLRFTKEEAGNFIELCTELKNEILRSKIVETVYSGVKLAVDDTEYLLIMLKVTARSSLYNSIVKFISENFSKFSRAFIETLPLEDLSAILHHSGIRLECESSLLELIMHLADKNPCYACLFETVQFKCVRKEVLSLFLDWLQKRDVTDVPQICFVNAIQAAIGCPGPARYDGVINRYTRLEFPTPVLAHGVRNGDIFDGIIRFLEHKIGPKPVTATWSSIYHTLPPSNYSPRGVMLGHHSGDSDLDPWFCYNFGTLRIAPTAISIYNRSILNEWHDGLKDFSILGSHTGQDGSWKELMKISDTKGLLNGNHFSAIFDIKPKPSEAYQYLKIQKTPGTKNHSGRQYLIFSGIEFFGDVYGCTE